MPGLDEQKKAQEELMKSMEEDFSDSVLLKQLKDQAESLSHRPGSWPQKEKNYDFNDKYDE